MGTRFTVPSPSFATAEIPDKSERADPLFSTWILAGTLLVAGTIGGFVSSGARGPHYTYYDKGRQRTGSRGTDRFLLQLLGIALGAGVAAPTWLKLSRFAGLAPDPLAAEERFRQKGLRRGGELKPEERSSGVTLGHRLAPRGDPSKIGCGTIGSGFLVLGLATVLGWEGYTPSPEMAAGIGFVMGTVAILAGMYVNWGQAHVEEAEVLVPDAWWPRGRPIPLRMRIVAARPMKVQQVRLELWRVESQLQLYYHKGWKLRWSDDFQSAGSRTTPVGAVVERGQELTLVDHFAIAPNAEPSRLSHPDQIDVASLESQTLHTCWSWCLSAIVELEGVPDAFFQWSFVEIVEAPGPGAAPLERARSLLVGTDPGTARCPFCGDGFTGATARSCTACDTLVHDDCWQSSPRCTTYACGSTTTRSVRVVVGG